MSALAGQGSNNPIRYQPAKCGKRLDLQIKFLYNSAGTFSEITV